MSAQKDGTGRRLVGGDRSDPLPVAGEDAAKLREQRISRAIAAGEFTREDLELWIKATAGAYSAFEEPAKAEACDLGVAPLLGWITSQDVLDASGITREALEEHPVNTSGAKKCEEPTLAYYVARVLEDLNHTLVERGASYSDIRDNSSIFMGTMEALGYSMPLGASPVEWHSTSMIASKLARIASGAHEHEDSWLDIAGYAILQLACIRRRKQGKQ